MRIFIGFDDTDTIDCGRGTGKLARWFVDKLPEDYICKGVVRQQLFHSPMVPMTSHNSSLCVIAEAPDSSKVPLIIDTAVNHIREHFVEGSDPGLCVVTEENPSMPDLYSFGLRCTWMVVTKEEALKAAARCHLSGHGGTNDGIIGAVAAVGLTWKGDSGRFVQYNGIRELPETTTVKSLTDLGMSVISVNRHAEIPSPDDVVNNSGSLRPRLFAGRAVVPVISSGPGLWNTINEKKNYQ